MAYIPGGTFRMGTDEGKPWEGPTHRVTVSPFWLDQTEVTVAAFREFVRATGHRTAAERDGFSKIFNVDTGQWEVTRGADWMHPEGPHSRAGDTEPVTQVSDADVRAFAKWAGKRLPTEAEWEFAARGGLDGAVYPWGNEISPGGRMEMNWWQGDFPPFNTREDGYVLRAPVASFPPNRYGLYDMSANVWEWCADWYAPDYYANSPARNPKGPASGTHRVVRGGSFLCATNSCLGFRVAARMKRTAGNGLNNVGFRCAKDARPAKTR